MSLAYRTTWAVLMFLTLWANCGIARNSAIPDLQVSVFNRAQVPEDKITQAEARAEKIMSRAGIHLTWLNCPVAASGTARLPSPTISESCRQIHYPEHVAITILERPRHGTADTFGQAFLNEQGSGSYIDVYYERVTALRTEPLASSAEIFGCVIAHEIGHLELGLDSHSKTGLMRAHWDNKSLSAAAQGQLLFSPSQVIAMQTTLTMASQRSGIAMAPSGEPQAGTPQRPFRVKFGRRATSVLPAHRGHWPYGAGAGKERYSSACNCQRDPVSMLSKHSKRLAVNLAP
jgi:hypothetical protein